MKKETILKLAIEKAVKNGWEVLFNEPEFIWEIGSDVAGVWFCEKDKRKGEPMNLYPLECIIFSHDFAKAFWGNEEVNCSGETHNDWLRGDNHGWKSSGLKRWQYYLQQLVLCKEPIKYLEKFL